MNYSKVLEVFNDVEEKYDLFSRKINNVYYWKLIRVKLVYKIIDYHNSNHIINNNTKSEKIIKNLSIFKNSLFKSPLVRKTNTIWIIENGRKVQVDKKLIDPHTYFNIKEMDAKDISVFESRHNGKLMKSEFGSNVTMDIVSLLYKIKMRFDRRTIHLEDEIDILLKIEKKIKDKLLLQINLSELIRLSVKQFIIVEGIYNYIFKRKKPSTLYISCSYGKEALIFAAKKNNVKVIEFQHGFIGNIHPGYAFTEPQKVRYLPDEFLSFGEYWTKNLNLPIRTEVIGYKYLESLFEYTQLNENKIELKSDILYLSQGPISKQLSKFAYLFALENPNLNIVYKLHPNEFNTWETENENLVKFSQLTNTRVLASEYTLYEIINTSEFIVGVNSTALFESIYFQKTIGVIDLPGHESMDEILNFLDIGLIRNNKDLLNQYENRFLNKVNYEKLNKLLWNK